MSNARRKKVPTVALKVESTQILAQLLELMDFNDHNRIKIGPILEARMRRLVKEAETFVLLSGEQI